VRGLGGMCYCCSGLTLTGCPCQGIFTLVRWPQFAAAAAAELAAAAVATAGAAAVATVAALLKQSQRSRSVHPRSPKRSAPMNMAPQSGTQQHPAKQSTSASSVPSQVYCCSCSQAHHGAAGGPGHSSAVQCCGHRQPDCLCHPLAYQHIMQISRSALRTRPGIGPGLCRSLC